MLLCIGLVLFTGCAKEATTQNLSLATSRDGAYGYVEYEIPPHYPGGISAWHNHVRSIINRPKVDGRIYTGTVFLNFMVKADSTVSDIKVVKGIHPTYDSLAVSILQTSEPWAPGTLRGQPIDHMQSIRIVFPRLK